MKLVPNGALIRIGPLSSPMTSTCSGLGDASGGEPRPTRSVRLDEDPQPEANLPEHRSPRQAPAHGGTPWAGRRPSLEASDPTGGLAPRASLAQANLRRAAARSRVQEDFDLALTLLRPSEDRSEQGERWDRNSSRAASTYAHACVHRRRGQRALEPWEGEIAGPSSGASTFIVCAASDSLGACRASRLGASPSGVKSTRVPSRRSGARQLHVLW